MAITYVEAYPQNPPRTISHRIWPRLFELQGAVDFYAVGSVLAILVLLGACAAARVAIAKFEFDDAYMFHRYAMNLRYGSGIAWNPSGPHSYGVTSPLWLLPVVAATFAGQAAATTMVWLSTIFGLIALAALTTVCRATARTPLLKAWPALLSLFGVVLWSSSSFRACMTNGMETMMGMAMICALIAASRRFTRELSATSALVLASVGLLSIMTRPESGIVVLLLPILMWFWTARARTVRPILIYLGIFFGLFSLYLLANRLYFGTAFPLPLYVKASHGYKGYSFFPNSMEYFVKFLGAVLPAALILLAFLETKRWRQAAIYLVPMLAVVAYLFSFTQIMGLDGRYFMPYLPLVVVPAMESLDRRWGGESAGSPSVLRLASILLLFLVVQSPASAALASVFHAYQIKGHLAYERPALATAAREPLPFLEWMTANRAFASYASQLPGEPSMALTEAGIAGSSAPRSSILDLTGLNDKQIALHGATPEYIFGQQPDIIWMPEYAYTWLRAQLLTDPRLLQNYDFYDGVFNYGVAIRKTAPMAAVYTSKLAAISHEVYPGTKLEEYKVTSVLGWDPKPFAPR